MLFKLSIQLLEKNVTSNKVCTMLACIYDFT